MVSAPDEVHDVEPAAAPTNDDGIDATRIHANVQPEASDVLPGIPIDTEQTNTGQIDATQIHANVQLEELPDIATIRSYTCPCQCKDDHEGYELQPPNITYGDWIASEMGSPYGHGCIPSAFLRMTQARLDYSAAEIMADTSIYATRLLAAASPHPPVPSDQRLHQAFGAVPLRQLVTEDKLPVLSIYLSPRQWRIAVCVGVGVGVCMCVPMATRVGVPLHVGATARKHGAGTQRDGAIPSARVPPALAATVT